MPCGKTGISIGGINTKTRVNLSTCNRVQSGQRIPVAVETKAMRRASHLARSERVQSVVIGAGVVGLAVARSLAKTGREVLVLESENTVGSATSSRNSGVIHAGIYYPQGSLKAKLCVAGRKQLYQFCDDHHVPHRRCGKVVVATNDSQLHVLEAIRGKAAACGVTLQLCSAEEVREREPAVRCVGGLWSPDTGIVDVHAMILALQGDAEAHGATVALTTSCTGGQVLRAGEGSGGRILVRTDAAMDLECDELVNCVQL